MSTVSFVRARGTGRADRQGSRVGAAIPAECSRHAPSFMLF